MKKTVFDFDSHIEIIEWQLSRKTKDGKKIISPGKLQEAIGMQSSHWSKAYKAKGGSFSDSQTVRMANYFGFKELEKLYFFHLTKYCQADEISKPMFKKCCENTLEEYKHKFSSKMPNSISEDQQKFFNEYIDDPIVMIVYVTLATKKYQDASMIARGLDIGIEKVLRAIRILKEHSIIEKDTLKIIPQRIKVKFSSDKVRRSHMNTRSFVSDRISSNVSYSPNQHHTYTLGFSKEMGAKLELTIAKLVESLLKRVDNSTENRQKDTPYLFTLDFIQLEVDKSKSESD